MARLFDQNTLVERQLNHLASWVHDQPQWWSQLAWDLDKDLDQQQDEIDRIFPLAWMEPMRAVASNLALLIDFKADGLVNGLLLANLESLLPPLVRHLKATVPHVSDNVTPTGMLGVTLCDGILPAAVLGSIRGFATSRREKDTVHRKRLVNPFMNMVSNRTYRSTTRNALFADDLKVESKDNKCYWLPSTFEVNAEGKASIESYINDLDPGMHSFIAGAFEALLPMFERALEARHQPQMQRLSQFRAKRIFGNEYPLKWVDKQCSVCLRLKLLVKSVLLKTEQLCSRQCLHRLEPFSLLDPSKDGHRTVLVFYLVDPGLKGDTWLDGISSEYMPRQEKAWVAHTVAGLFRGLLPREVCDIIAGFVPHVSPEEEDVVNQRMADEQLEAITRREIFSVSFEARWARNFI
ncbi:hypothetical protein HDU81_010809 [Chytriomyces hyalinus]|nr:hypothetical protein HDU81_010809 [Chytriomyces hyalinus]